MRFDFSKWQGAGNDFVIVNGFKNKIVDYAQTAIEVCDRHFGIGADGFVIILPSEKADFEMRIFNADGSEAEMCGNVTRCVARYVYEQNLTTKTRIDIETKAGIIKPELIMKNNQIDIVRVNMGEPLLKADAIPVSGFENKEVINTPISIGTTTYNITCVSMGNPHCVIFVEDIAKINLEKIGPLIENHPMFPKKTNVEFAEIKNKEYIRMRVWERGAAITMACGTGSCATLVAAVLNHKTNRKAVLALDGGDLFIEWAEDNCVYMSGEAKEVFVGQYGK